MPGERDYAMEVVQEHEACMGIKRTLKEKGIHFQTLLDKMRIHWDSGTRTYESAQYVAREATLWRFQAADPIREMEQLLRAPMWQRAAARANQNTTHRMKERLGM